MLPFVNTFITPFTLCLSYEKLSSHSTGLAQISIDVKLNVTDGAYKDVRGAEPRHP
jgi:hypothetical protein